MDALVMKKIIGNIQRRFSRISQNYHDIEQYLTCLDKMEKMGEEFVDESMEEDLRSLAKRILNASNAIAEATGDAQFLSEEVDDMISKKNKDW